MTEVREAVREKHQPFLVRVEKGSASPEEVAALTAVLLARAAEPAPDGDPGRPPRRPAARWRRPERGGAFDGPRTWQARTHEPSA
ncbi:acyl-CoA carboxylase subunit epsilon (plasmid) [Streptomyces sp. NBC_00335]|uniref:acyl-CoA carboxylase subunit epsilon n=1 Tax=unclassified Streptomyces TaxID=2593676 RepID=UPI002251FAF3|nr:MULTISPECIES: acyl-CoA carboxylase subunit epsilon [unclassified Streptomyces]MCX5410059.1 acyl-CoA carboxylase subunit epsilon [Streptomyces sp. NBC_00086]